MIAGCVIALSRARLPRGGEGALCKQRAIERPIRQDEIRSKCSRQGGENKAARPRHLAGDFIRIDHRQALRAQEGGRRAFARPCLPGQTNDGAFFVCHDESSPSIWEIVRAFVKCKNPLKKQLKNASQLYINHFKRGGTQQPVINSKAHALLFRAARIGGVDTHRVE